MLILPVTQTQISSSLNNNSQIAKDFNSEVKSSDPQSSEESSKNSSITVINEQSNTNSSKNDESNSDISIEDYSSKSSLESSTSILKQIDEDKIIYRFQINLAENEIIEYKDFIVDYFDNKIYDNGDIIDCKADIAKLNSDTPSEYYKVFLSVYSAWNFSTSPRAWEEKNATINPFTIKYELSDEKNLILKYSESERITLRVYCDEERAYFFVTK